MVNSIEEAVAEFVAKVKNDLCTAVREELGGLRAKLAELETVLRSTPKLSRTLARQSSSRCDGPTDRHRSG